MGRSASELEKVFMVMGICYSRFKTENMIHGPLVCKIEAQSILRAQQMSLQEPA